jgi:hypothetical protein
MRFGEPHPYPERGSHTDGASGGNKERVIVYICYIDQCESGVTPNGYLLHFVRR